MARMAAKEIQAKKTLRLEATKEGKSLREILSDKRRDRRFEVSKIRRRGADTHTRSADSATKEAVIEALVDEELFAEPAKVLTRVCAAHCALVACGCGDTAVVCAAPIVSLEFVNC